MEPANVLAMQGPFFNVQSLFMESLLSPILDQWQSNQHTLYVVVLVTLVIVGFYLLFKGGDWLTDGASGLVKASGTNPAVIGLTIVSMATSAPELFTSLTAATKGSEELIIGNLVGSNLANIGLILGIAVIVKPLNTSNPLSSWQWPFLFASTLLFTIICLLPHEETIFSRLDGGICLVLMLGFLFLLKKDAREKDVSSEGNGQLSTAKCVLLLAIAAGILWLGSEILVEGAVRLAREAGVGDAIIGLTLVAIGTSLPELAASLSLARHSQHAILLGNLVGSNIFNMLLVGGITGAIFTFKVPPELFQIEFPAMLILTGLLWLLTLGKSPMGKAQGFLLITLYLAAIAASTVFHG
ncbi:MAG: hypothetical protein CMI30_04110 [Opitutae bacterium]|mgnify:CR=1 FL=1|nr:hypothetical protein [Opitutae bacterium]|tara:strand:- start:2491 stop:3555 length:1065 start_codon:yes stop_codon:yes gene_type:complete